MFGQRVVLQAFGMRQTQLCAAAVRGQLAGFDEFGVFMCAAWQHIKHIFSPHDCKQESLGIAVDGGKEHMPAGLDQRSAGFDNKRWVGHML